MNTDKYVEIYEMEYIKSTTFIIILSIIFLVIIVLCNLEYTSQISTYLFKEDDYYILDVDRRFLNFLDSKLYIDGKEYKFKVVDVLVNVNYQQLKIEIDDFLGNEKLVSAKFKANKKKIKDIIKNKIKEVIWNFQIRNLQWFLVVE